MRLRILLSSGLVMLLLRLLLVLRVRLCRLLGRLEWCLVWLRLVMLLVMPCVRLVVRVVVGWTRFRVVVKTCCKLWRYRLVRLVGRLSVLVLRWFECAVTLLFGGVIVFVWRDL